MIFWSKANASAVEALIVSADAAATGRAGGCCAPAIESRLPIRRRASRANRSRRGSAARTDFGMKQGMRILSSLQERSNWERHGRKGALHLRRQQIGWAQTHIIPWSCRAGKVIIGRVNVGV